MSPLEKESLEAVPRIWQELKRANKLKKEELKIMIMVDRNSIEPEHQRIFIKNITEI